MNTDRPVELIARGVLRHGENILLCQNRKYGHIFLPGGHIDFGETARAALEREIREELGIDLKAGAFIGACEAVFEQPTKSGGLNRHHELNVVFELISPVPVDPAKLLSQEHHIQFLWRSIQDLRQATGTRQELLPTGIIALLDTQDHVHKWLTAFH